MAPVRQLYSKSTICQRLYGSPEGFTESAAFGIEKLPFKLAVMGSASVATVGRFGDLIQPGLGPVHLNCEWIRVEYEDGEENSIFVGDNRSRP